jgi:hypothetical protein
MTCHTGFKIVLPKADICLKHMSCRNASNNILDVILPKSTTEAEAEAEAEAESRRKQAEQKQKQTRTKNETSSQDILW